LPTPWACNGAHLRFLQPSLNRRFSNGQRRDHPPARNPPSTRHHP
jgi:hypothetical protein